MRRLCCKTSEVEQGTLVIWTKWAEDEQGESIKDLFARRHFDRDVIILCVR
jgi:hypothetical protein